MPVTAYDWLAHHARRAPNKVAAVDLFTGRRHTYGVFNDRATRLASYLSATLGVDRGDRVAVLAPNTTDVFELQFACTKLGAVLLPLNWRLTVPELEFIVNDAAPGVLVYDLDFEEAVQGLQARCGVPHLLELNGRGLPSAYEQAISAGSPELAPRRVTLDDLGMVMYTSGTTGRPKGAMITHGMTFYNAVNLGPVAQITAATVCLTVLPTFHTGGLNVYSNIVFHAGGTVLVMREYEPALALALLTDRSLGITHFFGVPAHYQFMEHLPEFAEAELRHLTMSGVGGAAAPQSMLQTWAEKGVPLQQGYGMTETSPSVTALDAEMAIAKLGSCGKPLLHQEVRVVGPDGQDVPQGEVGELWVRGPNVTPGYWNRPEATAESITDGWLHTGDAVRVDEDGYFYIVDRWKDMFISGGENVYPAEVENAIYEHPAVAEAAVIGLPDERWGEVGRAVVVLRQGQRLTDGELLAHCRRRLAAFKVPKSVQFVAELPHNATGKVLKRELRDQALAAAHSP
jgi:fatty-acyl-CoA synthase